MSANYRCRKRFWISQTMSIKSRIGRSTGEEADCHGSPTLHERERFMIILTN